VELTVVGNDRPDNPVDEGAPDEDLPVLDAVEPEAPLMAENEDDDADPMAALVTGFLPAGILALFLALCTHWIWIDQTVLAMVLLVGGVGLLALNAFYNWDRISRAIAHKRALVGANVIVMLALGSIILILVSCFNGCAEGLTEDSTLAKLGLRKLLHTNTVRATLGSADLTREGDHTLTDETRTILDNLDETLYILNVDMLEIRSRKNADEIEVLERVKALLGEYDRACPNIVLYNINAVIEREQTRRIFAQAGISSDVLPEGDSIVLSYGKKRQDIRIRHDAFIQRRPTRDLFMGERVVTSAILGLTSEQKKVYFLRGHGEKRAVQGSTAGPVSIEHLQDYRGVNRALRRNNFSVEELSLVQTPRVPDDCAVLVIAGPRVPIPAEEAKAVGAYLDRGGALFFLVDPDTGRTDLGLNSEMAKFGIKIRSDYLCHVWVGERAITTTDWEPRPFVSVPDTGYTIQPIVEPLRNRYMTRFYFACPVEGVDIGDENVEAQELFYMPSRTMPGQPTDNFAVRLVPGLAKRFEDKVEPREADGDILGSIPLAVASERGPLAGVTGGGKTRVVVIGDSDFALSLYADSTSPEAVPSNMTLFVNAVKWLGHRESYISIDAKTLEFARERADVSQFEEDGRRSYERAILVVPVVLVPGLVTFLGLIVWWRRRK
jgi:gliding motility-associatede transport system auxiliary component